jgi:hypothetical protein
MEYSRIAKSWVTGPTVLIPGYHCLRVTGMQHLEFGTTRGAVLEGAATTDTERMDVVAVAEADGQIAIPEAENPTRYRNSFCLILLWHDVRCIRFQRLLPPASAAGQRAACLGRYFYFDVIFDIATAADIQYVPVDCFAPHKIRNSRIRTPVQ